MSSYSIRPLEEADLPALLPLYRAYAVFYESEPTDEGLMTLCRSFLADPEGEGAIFCGCDADGAVVGFATLSWRWSSLWGARIGYLDDLFIDPDSRGSGLADALIAACAEKARERGAPAIQWLTQPQNSRARAVYDRVGGRAEPLIEYELKL